MSKYLCGFRKGYSSQYALLNMLRDWQKCLTNSGKVGAILMDLSKAFDCLPHDLLIAKIEAYGFGIITLKFMFSYLSKRKHRVRIGSFVSDRLEVLLVVPQGSVLGQILFNIFHYCPLVWMFYGKQSHTLVNSTHRRALKPVSHL